MVGRWATGIKKVMWLCGHILSVYNTQSFMDASTFLSTTMGSAVMWWGESCPLINGRPSSSPMIIYLHYSACDFLQNRSILCEIPLTHPLPFMFILMPSMHCDIFGGEFKTEKSPPTMEDWKRILSQTLSRSSPDHFPVSLRFLINCLISFREITTFVSLVFLLFWHGKFVS